MGAEVIVVACLDEETITDLLAGRVRLEGAIEQHLDECRICERLLGAARVNLSDESVGGPAGNREQPAFAPGFVIDETYEVRRLLGRGGMGEVYEVSHARLAGRYALKVLRAHVSRDQELLGRFRREAAISSTLRHPNIVQVIDFDRARDGSFYLVMEYLEGMDLGRLLKKEGPLAIERALRLAGQIANALMAAHRRGVIHRDLKPENVFVVQDEAVVEERVKLLDFGLSKWSGPSIESSAGLSRDQALIGTPRYMAPEQALGRNREISAATDQFAFAALVYEMLAGAPAFAAGTVAQLLYTIVYEQPRELSRLRPRLPATIAPAIARALAKAPGDRYASVADFYQALSRPASEVETRSKRASSSSARARAAAVAVVAIAISAAAWQGWSSDGDRSDASAKGPSLVPPRDLPADAGVVPAEVGPETSGRDALEEVAPPVVAPRPRLRRRRTPNIEALPQSLPPEDHTHAVPQRDAAPPDLDIIETL